MRDAEARYRAALARLAIKGEPALHIKADGTTEWIWGYFAEPRKVDQVQGIEIQLYDVVLSLRVMQSDAAHVCKYQTINAQSDLVGSKLVIRGYEYPVRDVHKVGACEVLIELSQDCEPLLYPDFAPPNCYADICALNNNCPAVEPPDNPDDQTPTNPPISYRCPY